jgi:integrin beta 3
MSIEQRLEDLAFGMGQRFAALRKQVDDTVALAIAELRLTKVERGEKGDPGEKGEKGETGVGEKGDKGDPGDRGERGDPGPKASFDAPAAWIEGVHYQGELTFLDGSTWCARCDTAQRPPHDDWAPVALAGLDGRTGDARGLYDPSVAYSKLDRVSLDGSEWIAKCDDPGLLPGDGWMLAARAGSRGKPGERGPKGERGERGIGVEQVTADGYALVLALSDGKTLKLDLRGMFERYDQERGG